MFHDYAKIHIKAGDGGNGAVSFRREKHVPKGGPNGGDGGDGGDVFLRASSRKSTLINFKHKKHFKAFNGKHGLGKNMHGAGGEDVYIDVPIGTLVRKDGSNDEIADLNKEGKKFLIARGGKGGKGNARFVSSKQTAPRIAENGTKGDSFWIELELKLISDGAIIGMPNAGKSTLISSVSRAKPKIADYPFTTVEPNLGVVFLDETRSFVVSDIPGLIEGASENMGLGHKFLRHIERSKVLIHLISTENDNLYENYKKVREELKKYSQKLYKKTEIIVVSKCDIIKDSNLIEGFKKVFGEENKKIFAISAVTGYGLNELKEGIWEEILTWEKNNSIKKEKQIPVFTVDDKEREIISVYIENNIYYVKGKKIEELVQKADFNSSESVDRLQRQLEKAGVFRALEQHGIKEDDEVEISGFRFNFFK
ncbi:MAG: GTPase ObgE [Candidatus Muiribacteriota bacterium]